jgi:hypothetical protein
MQINRAAPIRRDRPLAGRRPALTADSDLGAIILRMISSTSLAGLTPAIGRNEAAQPVRGIAQAQPASARADQAAAPQRPLEAVPPQPSRPMPRGSLLDLRV